MNTDNDAKATDQIRMLYFAAMMLTFSYNHATSLIGVITHTTRAYAYALAVLLAKNADHKRILAYTDGLAESLRHDIERNLSYYNDLYNNLSEVNAIQKILSDPLSPCHRIERQSLTIKEGHRQWLLSESLLLWFVKEHSRLGQGIEQRGAEDQEKYADLTEAIAVIRSAIDGD